MGSSKIHAGHLAVGVQVSNNSGNDVPSPLSFFLIQVLLIASGFAGLNFLQDVVNSGFRQ
jgi:hypothetical protein